MNFEKVKVIYFKEMKDTLRDRRTLISMILIPILLFPVMMYGMGSIMTSMIKKTEEKVNPIVILGETEAPGLVSRLRTDKYFEIVQEKDYSSAIKEKRIRAALEFSAGFEKKINAGDSSEAKIYYDKAEIQSEVASNKLENILKAFQDSVVTDRLKDRKVERWMLQPVRIELENIAPKEKMGGFFLSMILPYMLMIMALTGAMYPAIDLTAGEKERGTMETILVSPASRGEITAGKFLTVFTASFITSVVASASMILSVGSSFARFGDMAETGQAAVFSINPLSLLFLLLLMLPYCCLVSSILLSLALFAKSYKEAQSYISPLMIVIILPAMVSFMPGFELSTGMAFIPVMNMSMALKEVLLGTYNWGFIGLIFLSTAIYASIAIFITRRLFEKEQVLFRT